VNSCIRARRPRNEERRPYDFESLPELGDGAALAELDDEPSLALPVDDEVPLAAVDDVEPFEPPLLPPLEE
jgi:hypothetical protein